MAGLTLPLLAEEKSSRTDSCALGWQLLWLCGSAVALFVLLMAICWFGMSIVQAYRGHLFAWSNVQSVICSELGVINAALSTAFSLIKHLTQSVEPDWAALWRDAIGEGQQVDRALFVKLACNASPAATTRWLMIKLSLFNVVRRARGEAPIDAENLWAHIRAVLKPPGRQPGDFFDACRGANRVGRLSKDEFLQSIAAGHARRPGSWPYFFVLGPQNQGKSTLIKQILQESGKSCSKMN